RRGLTANIELADILRLYATCRLCLDVHAVQPAESIEVVDVGTAHERRQCREYIIDRHAQLSRLFTVELDRDLGSRRVERGEEVRQLGPLARLGQERLRLPAQILHRQRDRKSVV